MKKTVVSLLAALMVLAVATPVLAAPSKDAEAAAKPITEVKTESGVKLTVSKVTEEKVAEVYAEAEKKNEDSEILAVVEVSVPEGTDTSKGLKVTFDVTGVVAGEKIYLLHEKANGTWEVIHPDKVEDGKVTATFKSFSPVAVVKVPASATLPKTGAPLAVLPIVALVCAAGAAGCARKVK